jgi:hypothetical protein
MFRKLSDIIMWESLLCGSIFLGPAFPGYCYRKHYPTATLNSTIPLLCSCYNLVWFLASSMDLTHGFWRFCNHRFFWSGVISATPNPNIEDQALQFVWLLPCDLSCMDGSGRSLRSHQHSSSGIWGVQTSSPWLGGSPRGGNMNY